ncbi:MAG: cytochrome c oxidase assembly protein [Mycobacteriales bacterium]
MLAVDVSPFTPVSLFTYATLDSWLTALLLVIGGAYLYGVYLLRARGDAWPVSRTLLFVGGGLGTITLATLSGLAAYDDVLFDAHMVQHMLLAMVAPIFLALGAPITLALRTIGRRPRKILLKLLHSRIARVLSFPVVSFALFVATPYALYFSGLYAATLQNRFLHEALHAHFLLVGCLFFWPLIGLDPLPGRLPYPGRALLMFLSMPIHAVLGLTIMQSNTIIAGNYYASLGLSWLHPAERQNIGGGLLWASGDLVSLLMLAALIVQWIRASHREGAREDRRLDRLESQEAARNQLGAANPGAASSAAVRSAL